MPSNIFIQGLLVVALALFCEGFLGFVEATPKGGGGSAVGSGLSGGGGSFGGGGFSGGAAAGVYSSGNSGGNSSSSGLYIGVSFGALFALLGIVHCCVKYCKRKRQVSSEVSAPVSALSSSSTYARVILARPPIHRVLGGSLPTSFNESSGSSFNKAKRFQKTNPPPTARELTPNQIASIESISPRTNAWTFASNSSGSFAKGVSVSDDGLIITVKNKSLFNPMTPMSSDNDRSILSQHPLYKRDTSSTIYYFEATITDLSYSPSTTVVSVGVATSPYPSFRQVGWEAHSVGYHSDDGRLFHNDGFGGKMFESPFTKGDTVGCGYNPATGSVFFTLNGRFLGNRQGAVTNIYHPFHAAIGADGPCTISMNMGQREFMYNPEMEHSTVSNTSSLVIPLNVGEHDDEEILPTYAKN